MARVYRRGCRDPLRPASMHGLKAGGFLPSFRELRQSRYPDGNRRSSLLGARTPGPTSYSRRYRPITRRPVTQERSGPPTPTRRLTAQQYPVSPVKETAHKYSVSVWPDLRGNLAGSSLSSGPVQGVVRMVARGLPPWGSVCLS